MPLAASPPLLETIASPSRRELWPVLIPMQLIVAIISITKRWVGSSADQLCVSIQGMSPLYLLCPSPGNEPPESSPLKSLTLWGRTLLLWHSVDGNSLLWLIFHFFLRKILCGKQPTDVDTTTYKQLGWHSKSVLLLKWCEGWIKKTAKSWGGVSLILH